MAEEKTSTGGDEIVTIPLVGEVNLDEIERKVAKEKTKTKKTKAEPKPEPAVQVEVVEAEAEPVEEWVKPESDYTPSDWAAVNNPADPGVTDVSLSPDHPNITKRGFTTLHMAHAYRNQLNQPQDYHIVELRDVHGAILAYYVGYKSEEL